MPGPEIMLYGYQAWEEFRAETDLVVYGIKPEETVVYTDPNLQRKEPSPQAEILPSNTHINLLKTAA